VDGGDARVLDVDGLNLWQVRKRSGGHEVEVAVGPHHQLEPREFPLGVEDGPHLVVSVQFAEDPAGGLRRRLRVVDVAVAVELRVRRHVADVGVLAPLLGRLCPTARRLRARAQARAQSQEAA